MYSNKKVIISFNRSSLVFIQNFSFVSSNSFMRKIGYETDVELLIFLNTMVKVSLSTL